MHCHSIDLVIDVGANTGQYAKELRTLGYTGQILSCEPLSEAFTRLQATAVNDPHWRALRTAVGHEEGQAEINISSNSVSSSLVAMLDRHRVAAPDSMYIGREIVPVTTVRKLAEEHMGDADNAYLKVDVQGYERRVLAGAGAVLDRFKGVQLEVSLTPLYEEDMGPREVIDTMMAHGFQLADIQPGFTDRPTGQLLQCDAIFYNRSVVTASRRR
jgi:FkbM family methyltransferase